MTDYQDVNRANWDERVPVHVPSEYYGVERFASDPSHLSDSAPWNALPGKMGQIGGGEWRLADDPSRLPCTYTLQAVKSPGAGTGRA